MAGSKSQRQRGGAVWALAARQHGQVSHEQLVALGYTRHAIAHRVDRGRLLPTRPRVYAVGRPADTRSAEWMAAVLTSGPGGALSDGSAAAHWKISEEKSLTIHVTVPPRREVRQPS